MSQHVLNRAAFASAEPCVAIRVVAKRCGELRVLLKNFLANKPRKANIVSDGDSKDTKLMLLDSSITSADFSAFPEDLQKALSGIEVTPVMHEVKYDYAYYTADEVLRKVLPSEVEVPSSFETVGTVAHLNLREEHENFKATIGQVILEKNPRLKTVVNKTSTIQNEFRVFPMEVIAGENNLDVEVKENGAAFRFNFGEVYWNSRLQAEHGRLVRQFKRGAIVCDIFGGVGPFAVPAGMRGCRVYANDLNPKSHEYMVENIRRNKVVERVQPFNLDGREFFRKVLKGEIQDEKVKDGIAQRIATPGAPLFDHAVMNLPAIGVEFLDVLKEGLPALWTGRSLPQIHTYMFSKATDLTQDGKEQVERHMGAQLDSAFHVQDVRDVAPNKRMICVSFKIPQCKLPGVSSKRASESDENNVEPAKRGRTES